MSTRRAICCTRTAPADADADADYIWVMANHAEKKPSDPVKVVFEEFEVTRATFDPQNLEGGTAEIEIALDSLSSGSTKRDGHLKNADYLDVEANPKAIVRVTGVQKKTDQVYSATAEVSLHGVTKQLPVEFEVLDTTSTSVRVKATHAFKRTDFSVGRSTEEDSAADELTLELQLTLTAA